MKEILLTQGKTAQIDDEDFEYLNQWKWYAVRSHRCWYAQRNIRLGQNKRTVIQMHRQLMNPEGTLQVDHKDRDGLNNQRANLRICTLSQQRQNEGARQGTSQFRRVCWHKAANKWAAHIGMNGKQIYLGVFDTEEEAARAYDAKARELFGEFAYLNFPDE